jgi:16S rRNA (uracil1498-N3)-methyltransferase
MVEGLSAAEGKNGKKFFMRLVRRDGEFLLKVLDESDGQGDKDLRIVLRVGLLKQDQFETVLRVCAELGVYEIVPLACERSVPRFAPGDMPKKMSRWNKILAEATKVSGSVRPPALRAPEAPAAADWSSLPKTRYAAILSNDAAPVSSTAKPSDALALAVGPEGDWSDGETAALLQNSFRPISLGPRILRASTAVTAAVAYFSMSA